jgi:D-amino peptidase
VTKLFISADLEGACGVTSPKQCWPKPGDYGPYQRAVAQLAREVRAVIEGALEAGATAFVVNDSHAAMANLWVQDLVELPSVSLLSGKPKPCAMSAGLDKTFDGAVYVGYHAKAGTEKAVLCHSFHDLIVDIRVNGASYGEAGINALYASLAHQVPVILASGDAALCHEVKQLIPTLETVCTKTGLSFSAALNRPEGEVLQELKDKAKRLLTTPSSWKESRLSLQAPYVLEVTLAHTLAADVAMTMPFLTRANGCTVAFTTGCFETLYKMLQSVYSMLAYSHTFT